MSTRLTVAVGYGSPLQHDDTGETLSHDDTSEPLTEFPSTVVSTSLTVVPQTSGGSMSTIHAVVDDVDKVVAFTLRGDPSETEPLGVPASIDGETLECHLFEQSSGETVVITGITGEADGVATVDLSGQLSAGRWSVEFQVVGGLTYPEAAVRRPMAIVRPEVA